jgi:predicted enzyme related to lactoylglutathione lyase
MPTAATTRKPATRKPATRKPATRKPGTGKPATGKTVGSGAKKAAARKTARPGAKTTSTRKGAPMRVGCVYLMAQDMGRAIEFYTAGLGLSIVVRYDNEWAELDGGDVRLGLHPSQGSIKGEGGAMISFYVPDLDAAATRVRAAGGSMGAIHTTPRGRMSMGRDTEGNGLHFSEFDPQWVRRARYPLQKWARR